MFEVMAGISRRTWAAALISLVLALVGCGGSGDRSGAGTAAEAPSTAPSVNAGGRRSEAPAGQQAQEPAAQFRTPGGDNSIQTFGSEAEGSERQAAAAVVSGFLHSHWDGDTAVECKFLSKVAIESFESVAQQSPKLKGKSCPKLLSGLSAPLPPGSRPEAMAGPVASFRVEGDRGFALYHGREGDYFVQLVKEDGKWKVATPAAVELP